MIITHHREKLINAIIYFVEHTKNLGKTKLMKLLFFLDFRHFKETGKSVTGLDYFAWQRGPVPRDVWKELSAQILADDIRSVIKVLPGEGLQRIKTKVKFDDTHFTPRELRLLEELSEIYRDATAEQIVEVSHLKNQPWHRTLKENGENTKIDYLLAADGPPGLSREEAEERRNSIEEMHQALGVS